MPGGTRDPAGRSQAEFTPRSASGPALSRRPGRRFVELNQVLAVGLCAVGGSQPGKRLGGLATRASASSTAGGWLAQSASQVHEQAKVVLGRS